MTATYLRLAALTVFLPSRQFRFHRHRHAHSLGRSPRRTPSRTANARRLDRSAAADFHDKFVEDHDLIVMGDFNVPKIGDKLFQALTSRGLKLPFFRASSIAFENALGDDGTRELVSCVRVMAATPGDRSDERAQSS